MMDNRNVQFEICASGTWLMNDQSKHRGRLSSIIRCRGLARQGISRVMCVDVRTIKSNLQEAEDLQSISKIRYIIICRQQHSILHKFVIICCNFTDRM